jgi:hypothetical protein
VTLAWLAVVKSTGLTPLAAGMWPKFLSIYAGLWVSSHFMRPIRLSMALAAAPFFDGVLRGAMARLGVGKPAAFALMLGAIAIGTVGSLTALIAVCGGFPPGGF